MRYVILAVLCFVAVAVFFLKPFIAGKLAKRRQTLADEWAAAEQRRMERKEAIKSALRDKKFVVLARERKGSLTVFEAVLAETLISLGAQVWLPSRDIAKKIWDGDWSLAPEDTRLLLANVWNDKTGLYGTFNRFNTDARLVDRNGTLLTANVATVGSFELDFAVQGAAESLAATVANALAA